MRNKRVLKMKNISITRKLKGIISKEKVVFKAWGPTRLKKLPDLKLRHRTISNFTWPLIGGVVGNPDDPALLFTCERMI